MVRRFRSVLIAALLAITGTGCGSFLGSHDVGVSLVDLLPTQATVFETGATLTLRFTNETPKALELKGSAHRLYLNGSYVGRGVTNDALVIPALGTATQRVAIYLENLALFRKAVEFSHSPSGIEYRLESQLYPAGSGAARIRTATTGQLDLRPFMQATSGMTPEIAR